MSKGLLLSDDLLFKSRIIGTAKSLGLEIAAVSDSAALLARAQAYTPACVLIDVQNPGLDIAAVTRDLKAAGKPCLVAYGSHVDAARLNAAREAGCDVVLPRSRFLENLSMALPKWFAADVT